MAVSLAVVMVAGVSLYRVEQKTGTDTVTSGPPVASVEPGTAVGDLQTLDKNHDVFTDSDPDTDGSLLDDLQVQNDVSANP
jgi:hypothetical protein